MAVNSITYAHRLNLIDSNNQVLGGFLSAYESANNPYFNFTGARPVKFSLHVTGAGVFEEIKLYELNNGLTMYLNYSIEDDGSGYRVLRTYYLKKNNEIVVMLSPSQYTNYFTYNPQHSWRPFDNCVQFASFTYYNTNPTIAGDAANHVVVPGYLFFVKAAVIGEPVELTGSLTFSEVGSDWESVPSGNSKYSDNELNALKESIVAAGNGNDPFTEEEPTPAPDPSQPGGGDRPTGGSGDPVDFPGLPTTNVLASGIVSMYNPDNTQLRSLTAVLWGNDFEQTIKKILNDPFDAIIGLSLIPFSPTTSGSENCIIGNFDTEVDMPIVLSQWINLKCGSLKISESWRNALDYSPNTIIDIFIPFVGFRELKTEDVMNNTITLEYNVDLLSGAAIAMIKCGNKVMYTYPCKLTYDVPLTGSNKAALYTGMINIAMSAIRGAAMGGALGAAGGAATSAIQTATSKQSNIDRTGSLTSNTGDLGEFTPYIVIHRPVQSMPDQFKFIKGYQSNVTALLGACSGYTEVDFIHLDDISGATDSELNEIERLLKSGVLI